MRLKKGVLIFLFLSFLSRIYCQSLEHVLNDCFLEVVGTDYYEPFPPPPLHIRLDKFSSEEDSLEYNSAKREYEQRQKEIQVNNRRKIIIVNDSCLILTESLKSQIKSHTGSAQKGITKKLLNSPVYPKAIKSSQILNTGEYTLIPASQKDTLSGNYRIVGLIYLTDIIISNENEAVLYYEFFCGGECGYGSIIYLSYVDGKWRVRKRYELWIS